MTDLEQFTKVCSLSEIKENQGKKIIVRDQEVALFKVKGNVYALSNICPHQHMSIIYDGMLDAGHVFCPAHGWQFNLETGKESESRGSIQSFETKIIDGEIWIKIVKKELKW